MDNKTFNAQESIRLIEQTLRRSGQRLEEGYIIPMLVWGYATVAVSLLIYFLLPTMSHAHWLWLLIPLLGYLLNLSFYLIYNIKLMIFAIITVM